MNQGNLLGFTKIKSILPGESYPEIKVRYIHEQAYTLVGSDIDYLLLTTNSNPVTLTLPQELTVKNGVAIHIGQDGAGQVTVAVASSVVLRVATGLEAKTREQYSVVSLMKADPDYLYNQWYIFGDLAAATEPLV